MDKIILPRIDVTARHGVDEAEKYTPQPFLISLTLYVDTSRAAATDEIGRTVDYARLYHAVKQLAVTSSFNLLETLAERIAHLALAESGVEKVRVRVEKTAARSGEEVFPAAVQIERERQ